MCTAICLRTGSHYFGRTLDLECGYAEQVTITPRNVPLHFRHIPTLQNHLAFIGMATPADGTALYYDGVNEKGLCVAGLNFPGNAVYFPPSDDKTNIAHFELIPWVLGTFSSVRELIEAAKKLNITNEVFSEQYPAATLHWLVSDSEQSVVLESTQVGLTVYSNPWDVLTNNPSFPKMTDNLRQYAHLNNLPRAAGFTRLPPDSKGTGAIGLPGDNTSRSRFARASYHLYFSVCGETEADKVGQFFHILGTVAQVRGSVKNGDRYVITQYTSCCNAAKGIYYYTTYDNAQITAVRMFDQDLDADRIVSYDLIRTQQIRLQR